MSSKPPGFCPPQDVIPHINSLPPSTAHHTITPMDNSNQPVEIGACSDSPGSDHDDTHWRCSLEGRRRIYSDNLRRVRRDDSDEYDARGRRSQRRSPTPPPPVPYVTVNQTWNESNMAWTPTANVASCTFVVYRRRRALADSERVFTLVQFVDRGLLNSVRAACPMLDGLYAHDGMVSLNLLYPHIEKLRHAPHTDGLPTFLEFLEGEYEPHRKRIEALVADGLIKYEYLWAVYKPGAQVCVRVEGTDYIGGIVDSAEYLTASPGPYFVVKYRTLEWTGEKMYWAGWASSIAPFEGCEYITAVGPRLADDEERTRMAVIGRKFLQYADASVHHVEITGTMTTTVARDVSARGRGMVDPMSYSRFFPARQAGLHLLRPFEHPVTRDGMPDDMLWLLPAALECYSFAAHTWGVVRVTDVAPVVYDEKAWGRLVLGADEKDTIRALVEQQRAAAVSILLHGPTALGKTFTAEALADALRRPLYPISSEDHNAPFLRSSVDLALNMAERWNAVMLLEDVNGLCASPDAQQRMLPDFFLQALEGRRSGALFLTALRRDALPPALLLRVTYAVEYTPLDVMERLQIWERSVDDVLGTELLMMARSREDQRRSLHDFALKPFNASSIQSIVQTALALAVFEQEPLDTHHFTNVMYAKGRFLLKAGLLGPDYPDSENEEDEGSEPSETD